MNITATVAMPLYNMGKIAELALEGLCNQVTDYKWELIVCEEQNENMLGLDKVEEYIDRLELAGCKIVQYIPVFKWMPLGMKWKKIAKEASKSFCFILQSGDCYSHHKRIQETTKAFDMKWVQYYDEQQGYFYSFKHKKTLLFNPDESYHHPCRLNMAWDTRLIKKLPDNDIKKSVDKYIYFTLKKMKPNLKTYRNFISFTDGVDTDGYNQISKRDKFFTKTNNIFKETNVDIAEELPILKKFAL